MTIALNQRTPLCAPLQTARAKKLEAQTKLDGLQRDIEQLGKLSGEQARAEEAQVQELQQVTPPPLHPSSPFRFSLQLATHICWMTSPSLT